MSNNMDKQSYIDEAEKELLHTYNRFSLVLDHGEGDYSDVCKMAQHLYS